MKEERQAATGKGRPAAMKTAQAKATPIAEIEVVGEDRRLTQIGEFDRVLGGGIEYAFAPNFSAKIEYLYADLGTETYLALPALDPTPRTHDVVVQTVRAGLNYRFGGPGYGGTRY